MMKKTYIEPQMKVVEVKMENMICGSELSVYIENDPDRMEDWEIDKYGW